MSTPTSHTGDHSALGCYQALHRAFDDTLARNARGPSLVPALVGQSFDSFAGNLAIQGEGEPALACKRGCATCCTLRVGVTAPEAWLVARFLRQLSPGLLARGIDLVARVREADAVTRSLGEEARVAERRRCPFLAQGVCVIYGVRPLACRGHASHDVAACADAAAGRVQSIPYSSSHQVVRSLVQNAMQSALRDAGLAWHVYEFNAAIVAAFDDPQAEAAWLEGGDPLAHCAVDEDLREEMVAVFDQLRP